MQILEFLVPTYGRAKTSLPTFHQSFLRTSNHPECLRWTYVVNRQDRETQDLLSTCPQTKFLLEDLPKPHLSRFWNLAYLENPWKGRDSDAVVYIGDDFTCETQGWDDMVRAGLAEFDGMCLVSGPDQYLGNEGCPTWFATTREFIGPGPFCWPEAEREGSDKAWGEVARILDRMNWLDDCVMNHHHATRDPAGMQDVTYHRLQGVPAPALNSGSYWAWIKEKCEWVAVKCAG